MDRKTVNAELRRQFYPLLVEAGFVRKGDVARRTLDHGVVHVAEVQHLPRNNAIQVNVGVHLLALGDSSIDSDGIREYDCAWRGSILAGFRNASDAAFAYGRSTEEASESIAFLASEWPRQSEAFFGPLSDYPEGFRAAAERSLSLGAHPAHARTWARVAVLLGDGELARRIAAEALPRVSERATSLRDDLQAIAEG